MNNTNKNITREYLKDYFIKALEEPTLLWDRGWKILSMVNSKGNPYRGINNIVLSLEANRKGYKDNRWVTYNNCKDLSLDGKSAYVRKGEKATYIEYWYCQLIKPYEMDNDEYKEMINKYNHFLKRSDNPSKTYIKNSFSLDEYKRLKDKFSSVEQLYKQLKFKNIPVYNGDQIENIIPLENEVFEGIEPQDELLDICNNYIRNEHITYEESILGDAYYSPIEDKIHLPMKSTFDSKENYISTLVHEIAHSTGHECRLHRWDVNGFSFASEEYALEELNAEISAVLLCSEYNITMTNDAFEKHLENHKAYIQSWCKALKEDDNAASAISSAFLLAEGIGDYIKRRANTSQVKEDSYEKYFLNTKSIIECNDRDEVQHIKENTDIIDKLSKYSKEDCSIEIDYYDAYGMFRKNEKVSCDLAFAIDEIPQHFDIKNGSDFYLEGKTLVMSCYGKSIELFDKAAYKTTKMRIHLKNNALDFKDILISKKIAKRNIHKKM